MAKERKLLDCYGNFLCCLTRAESISLQNSGAIAKVGKFSYRYNTPQEPSKSEFSPACLTGGNRNRGDGGDMHTLASLAFSGSRITLQQRERFQGWGLLNSGIKFNKPDAKPYTRGEVRALYVDDIEEMANVEISQSDLPAGSAFLPQPA